MDGAEVQLKELFKEYRHRRDEFIANLEAEKEKNLQVKLGIIEELKELVNSDETLNHTFNKFRELQQRWKETGIVPQQNVKDLWETYNLHVENFYSFIKINKELRDLDLKKNYEQKIALCEQAEALVLEPSVVEAFHKLQKLHDEWRETGPVANEYKEVLWSVSRRRRAVSTNSIRSISNRSRASRSKTSNSRRSFVPPPRSWPRSRSRPARSGTVRATACWRSRRPGKPSASHPRRTTTVSTSVSARHATSSSRPSGSSMPG